MTAPLPHRCTLARVRRLACAVFPYLLAVAGSGGCAGAPGAAARAVVPVADAAPAALLGAFVDDYGNRYTITTTLWTQRPRGRFLVRRWDTRGGFLIAQNDSANRHAPGRWTRIDWVALPEMAPWTWAFCLSAFEAPSAAAAESTTVARPETPRTGCNGFPFSRMRRDSTAR